MTRNELETYIAQIYNTDPEYPWLAYPTYAVFRHQSNRKWFAVVMEIPAEKLGLSAGGNINVVNLKCDPLLIGSLRNEPVFFPAYHMSKAHWITATLDGSAPEDKLKWLLDLSFELTSGRKKNQAQK